MKNILVTGATGFIGASLLNELCKDNEVYVIVLPDEVNKIKQNYRVTIIEGNLEQIDEIENKLKGIEFDLAYHMAWIGVSTEYKNDYELQMKNLDIALNLMKLLSKHKCKRVISTGSVSEYAYVAEKIDGKQIPMPCDAYSATKVAVRVYCDLYARQNDMNFNWVLIPSIYGPGRNDNNLISYCIKKLLRGEKPSFTKLEQKWDYIYISDLINALILIGQNARDNTIYPVGSGNARKMSEYVEIIKNIINPNATLGIGDLPYKTDKIDNAVVEITRTSKDTGFTPQVSFEEGIMKTIDYFRNQENINV